MLTIEGFVFVRTRRTNAEWVQVVKHQELYWVVDMATFDKKFDMRVFQFPSKDMLEGTI